MMFMLFVLMINVLLGFAIAGSGVGVSAALMTAILGAAAKMTPGIFSAYWKYRYRNTLFENAKSVLFSIGEGSARGLQRHRLLTLCLVVFVSVMLLLPVFYMWHDMLATPKPTGWTKFFYMFTDETDSKFERQLDLAMITTAQMVGLVLALWLMYIMFVCGWARACGDPPGNDDASSASSEVFVLGYAQ